jgi:hypothetical protein
MEKQKNNIEQAKAMILKTFYFLETDYYCAPHIEIKEDKNFKEYLSIKYANQISRREINITYTKGDLDNITKYTFGTSIYRLPYSSWGDMFSLREYLQPLGKYFNTSMDLEFNPIEAQTILDKLVKALKEYTSEILKGDIWYEKYHPKKD